MPFIGSQAERCGDADRYRDVFGCLRCAQTGAPNVTVSGFRTSNGQPYLTIGTSVDLSDVWCDGVNELGRRDYDELIV